MTTILIILAVIILVLVLIIKSMDKQLELIMRELNEIWMVLTELRDKDNGKTVEIQSK